MRVVLASQSPRRRELMGLITREFTCVTADVDEAAVTADSPAALAGKLAGMKAGAVAALHPEAVVVGCDTVVQLAGETLGKPDTQAEALAMLHKLSGKRHLVHTGVAIVGGGRATGFVETTAVYFLPLPEEELIAYTAGPEPYDKAGGYGIQGWAARYIPRVEGCFYNVMGLPVAALNAALRNFAGG